MAKKSKKPKAKPLPAKAKKKGAKKPARPSRGFEAAIDRVEESMVALAERVRSLEQWRWQADGDEGETQEQPAL